VAELSLFLILKSKQLSGSDVEKDQHCSGFELKGRSEQPMAYNQDKQLALSSKLLFVYCYCFWFIVIVLATS
jgi:hypothetical protein